MAHFFHDRSRVGAMDPAVELEQQESRLAQAFPQPFVIVPSSRDLVLKWAEVMVATRRSGRGIETADAWVAATALLYNAPLLTHNKPDYGGVPNLRFGDELSGAFW